MKVTKDGRVKLEFRERRAGNYFFKMENGHIKIQDINGVFSVRVSVRMPIGIWLKSIIEKGAEGEATLKTYAAVLWSMLSVAPDDEFVQDIIKSSQSALERHPDWYGFKADASEEENREAEQEGKELAELEKSLKEMPDAPDAAPSE